MKRDMKITRLFRKQKNQSWNWMKRNKLATDLDIGAMHNEMIRLREDVANMKGAMRDMRDEIADLTGKSQSEVAQLE